MYEQQPQPNYATQPQYAAPAHVVGDRKQVDWRLMGAYIVAALGVGCAIVCLWFLSSFKQVYAAQMAQTNRALATARAVQAKSTSNINDLSGRLSTAENQLVLIAPYVMVCQQYLTGPSGGPETFSFPCTDKKVGS
jgi:hypothetical protein